MSKPININIEKLIKKHKDFSPDAMVICTVTNGQFVLDMYNIDFVAATRLEKLMQKTIFQIMDAEQNAGNLTNNPINP